MSTVLYHKNGVITEDRFKNMTYIQWIFHYMEIMKFTTNEKVGLMKQVNLLDESIQAFYLLINPDGGKALIENLLKARKERRANENNINRNDTDKNKPNNDSMYNLTEEDKELLEFYKTVPKTIKETKQMRNAGKYILPKGSIKRIKNSDKPNVGFRKAGENNGTR